MRHHRYVLFKLFSFLVGSLIRRRPVNTSHLQNVNFSWAALY